MYGRPEQVGARSRGKGYIAPRHVVTGTVCAHFRSPVAVKPSGMQLSESEMSLPPRLYMAVQTSRPVLGDEWPTAKP